MSGLCCHCPLPAADVLKIKERDVCMTYKDIQVRHVIEDLCKNLGKKGGSAGWRADACACVEGAALCAKNLPNTLLGFVQLLLCPKLEGEIFHEIACLEATCKDCGVARLREHG